MFMYIFASFSWQFTKSINYVRVCSFAWSDTAKMRLTNKVWNVNITKHRPPWMTHSQDNFKRAYYLAFQSSSLSFTLRCFPFFSHVSQSINMYAHFHLFLSFKFNLGHRISFPASSFLIGSTQFFCASLMRSHICAFALFRFKMILKNSDIKKKRKWEAEKRRIHYML